MAYELPVNDAGWAAFLRAKKVRDRLMHPRMAKDLEVTDSELADTTQAADWFQAQHQELSELMIDEITRGRGMSEAEVMAFREYRRQIVREEITKQADAHRARAV